MHIDNNCIHTDGNRKYNTGLIMSEALFYNGIIHTMVSESDTKSYMLVRDGKILEIGEGNPKSSVQTKIDLNGQHVYPCLIDGHTHTLLTIASMAVGFNACEITESGVTPNTIDGIRERITKLCSTKKENDIVVFQNYITSAIKEERLPNKKELDAWGNGRAIVVYNIDGHSMSLSSKMFAMVKKNAEQYEGPLYGEECEKTQGLIIDMISSSLSVGDIARGVAILQNKCAEYGIGMIGSLEGSDSETKSITTKLYTVLAQHFDIDVRLYLQYTSYERVKSFEKIMTHKRVGGCNDWEMDGAVGAHTAAFSIPFKDTNSAAKCYYTQKECDELVKAFADKGYQIASHAIGDKAVEQLTNALEKIDNGVFHRIEHGEFLNEETYKKLLSGKYAIMMQPGYSWIDKRYLHTYDKYLQESVLENELKLGSLLRNDVCICGSSDSPVQDIDPYLQMQGMTEYYAEAESITPYEAMCTYTKNAAKAMLEDDNYGTLEQGKTASFFTAGKDFFKLGSGEIISFRPSHTYYKGIEYKEKQGSVLELLSSLFTKKKMI